MGRLLSQYATARQLQPWGLPAFLPRSCCATLFYLAQSWRDAGDLELALRYYQRRFDMEAGWADERWFSLYQVARIKQRLGHAPEAILQAFLDAWEFMPDRAEPLYRAAMIHQGKRSFRQSHLLLDRARQLPRPGMERLFVETDLYDIHIPMEFAVAAFYVGDHSAAISANRWLLNGTALTPELRAHIQQNLAFSTKTERAVA